MNTRIAMLQVAENVLSLLEEEERDLYEEAGGIYRWHMDKANTSANFARYDRWLYEGRESLRSEGCIAAYNAAYVAYEASSSQKEEEAEHRLREEAHSSRLLSAQRWAEVLRF